jgi:hypothetical protein
VQLSPFGGKVRSVGEQRDRADGAHVALLSVAFVVRRATSGRVLLELVGYSARKIAGAA